ncbi:MAG: hypothetical protein WC861_01950 [Candidatus Micrarchaeia archaeon]|jgi:hypothetical protein
MSRIVRVILKDQAKSEFEELEKIAGGQEAHGEKSSLEMQLLKSIRQKIECIKANPVYGESIPKYQIPRGLAVSNLFQVKLSNYWRMVYTLDGNQAEVIAFILYITDHPTYDRIFGYKKK